MLEGYKVLDFTQVLAGPTTSRYMAELGAEVVKVEIEHIIIFGLSVLTTL